VRALDQRKSTQPHHRSESEIMRSGRRNAAAAVTTHVFVVRAHFRQRFALADGPRADRKGGGGLSTAFHVRPISTPAVASGRRPRRGKSVLGAVKSASGISTCDGRCRTCEIQLIPQD
jgi:hypothetical protein